MKKYAGYTGLKWTLGHKLNHEKYLLHIFVVCEQEKVDFLGLPAGFLWYGKH